MRRVLGLILLLQFGNVALTQEIGFNQGGADTTGYYIGLPYIDVDGTFIVKAEVGGKLRSFIFDTGAATCISQKLADELMLAVDKEEVKAVDQSGKKESAPVVILDHIKLADVVFKGIPSVVFEKPTLFDCFKVDGIIGSNLLRNSIVKFSGEDNTIVVTDLIDSLGLDKKYATKLYPDNVQSNPYFTAKLGGFKVQLLFDSGSNGLMALSMEDYNNLQSKKVFQLLGSTYGNSSVGMFGVADNAAVHRIYIPKMTIGRNRLANAVIETTAGKSSMGIKILKYGKVTIDYINKMFYFEPNEPDEPYVNVKEKYWTISPSMQDGALIVGTVWDNLGQNVNQGDRIIAIDGTRKDNMSECEILTKPLIDRRKNEALLTIEQKDGVRRNVKIIKQ